jgi:DNA-directed RNA polymerase subunit beta'
LKENVIVGRLIPAGTGAMMSRVKKLAAQRDQEVLEKQRQQQALLAAEAEAKAAAEEEGEQTSVA